MTRSFPTWSSPRQLLESMDGSWQLLGRELSQAESRELFSLVTLGLIEVRFRLDAVSIGKPERRIGFHVVATGDYAKFLNREISKTIAEFIPDTHFNAHRRLDAVRRTAWGQEHLLHGYPPDLSVALPSLRVCDLELDEPLTNEQPWLSSDPPPQKAHAEASIPPPAIKNNRKPRMTSGDVNAKLFSFLMRHHEYDEGVVRQTTPAVQKSIYEETDIAESTISKKFAQWFGGREKYVELCRNGKLGSTLQRVLGESPSWHG